LTFFKILSEENCESYQYLFFAAVRPFFVTSKYDPHPIITQIPGTAGEQVQLNCIAGGNPSPSLSWKRDLNATALSSSNDEKVNSITMENWYSTIMKVNVTNVGEKFYCVAVNLLGSINQQYTIRKRGLLITEHLSLIILPLTNITI